MITNNKIMKHCPVCDLDKPRDEFHRDKSKSDGRVRSCKKCVSNRIKIYRLKNKEIIKIRKQKYHLENKDSLNKISRQYYYGHKREHQLRNKQYYEKNKEHCYTITRQWKKKNRDKALLYGRKSENKRRSIKANTESNITLQQINKLIEDSNNICFWCEEEIPQGKMHLDHIYPLSKNGKHEISNLAVSCQSCNCRKYNKDPEIFLEEILRERSIKEN